MVRGPAVRIGDEVMVPWGLDTPRRARVLEVWGEPPAHVRVQLLLSEGDDEDPVVLLLSPSMLQAA